MKRSKGLAITFVLLAAIMIWGGGCGKVPQTPAGVGQHDLPGTAANAWVMVPAGEFLSGQFNEVAATDRAFEIMTTEVTNEQYADYLEEALKAGAVEIEDGRISGYYPGDEFHGGKHEAEIKEGYYLHMDLNDLATRIAFEDGSFRVVAGYEHHPVSMVSWFGAKAYADFHGYRLPTELEWEKAARGTDGRPFPWGDEIGHQHANYYHSGDPFETSGGYSDTTPVGFYNGETYGDFETGQATSPYGLYDMAGNVGEWTADIHYKLHDRTIRGGSKASYEIDLRVWKSNSAPPGDASPSVGFRCVRDPR